MRKRITANLLLFTSLLWMQSCGGSREVQNQFAADPSWAGLWKGQALTIGTQEPPGELMLEIRLNNSGAMAYLTDPSQHLRNFPIKEMIFEENTIRFKISHDTRRGLRRIVVFRGIRMGQYLKAEFSGSEGGRAFRGKWQARLYSRAYPEHTTEPAADSTSSSGI